MQRIIEIATDKDSIMMDSFAGTGTLGHAVLAANARDGGERRFVLTEVDPTICQTVTAQRLRRAVNGHQSDGKPAIAALGGGFRYCRLGESLLDGEGRVPESVSYGDLARHVYFSETGEPLAGAGGHGPRPKRPMIGTCRGTAFYLLYNGVLGDRRPAGGNVLTSAVLQALPAHDGPRVIFGEACRLGPERLRRAGITFKQIPYQIRTS